MEPDGNQLSSRGLVCNTILLLLILLLLFHMDYLYNICLLAAVHTPPVSLGADVTISRELHSSSFCFLLLLWIYIKVLLLCKNLS